MKICYPLRMIREVRIEARTCQLDLQVFWFSVPKRNSQTQPSNLHLPGPQVVCCIHCSRYCSGDPLVAPIHDFSISKVSRSGSSCRCAFHYLASKDLGNQQYRLRQRERLCQALLTISPQLVYDPRSHKRPLSAFLHASLSSISVLPLCLFPRAPQANARPLNLRGDGTVHPLGLLSYVVSKVAGCFHGN